MHVARISIAPVKALGLVHPEQVELGPRGPVGDRRFWLVDADGRLFNDLDHGPLVRIRPEWDEATRVLALAFPDGSRVEGVVEPGEPVSVEMYEQPRPSRAVLGPWQDALSRYAGEPLTLLWADEGAADRGPRGGTVTVVSRASLARVAEAAGEGEPLDGRRFRMTFELEGTAAHEEDDWLGAQVRIGDAVVELHGEVGRCAITTHHPDSGVRDVDTLAALARYRREGRTAPLPLGVWGSVVVPGRVRVGDAVEAPALAPT